MKETIENMLNKEETPTWQNPLLKWKRDLEDALLEEGAMVNDIQDKLRMLESIGV